MSAICERFQHRAVDASALIKQIRKDIAESPEVVLLRDRPGNVRITSTENWEIEQKLLKDAESLREQPGATITIKKADRLIAKRRTLDDEQKKAARKLLTESGSVRVLAGVAGSGKSTTLEVVKEGFERAGFRVLGGALAGKAAQELADKTGMKTRTVASYLHHMERTKKQLVADRVRHDVRMLVRALAGRSTWRHQRVEFPKKCVLVIDEAGMLDTRTLSRLMHHAKEKKATVILAGDEKQLPPILAGGPMGNIAQQTKPSRLKTNRRQQSPEDREAVAQLREGKIEESLRSYAERGRLHIAEDQPRAIESLVTRWKEIGGHRRPTENLILVQTRAEASAVNNACQQVRLRSLRSLPGLSVRHGEHRYYIGDQIAFRTPMRNIGVENGHTGRVVGVDPLTRRLTVRLDHDPAAQNGSFVGSRIQRVSLIGLDKEAISLGYASTTHRAQGMTCKRALVLLSGAMISNELAYTQLTRARERTEIFINKDQAGEDLEELVASLERSVAKNLAHDVVSVSTKSKEKQQREGKHATPTHELNVDPGNH